jgi:hypothetical protein
MRSMAGKTSKTKREKLKRVSRGIKSKNRPVSGRPPSRHSPKVSGRGAIGPSLPAMVHMTQSTISLPSRPVFSIEIASISGDTTIGDLIVAFPRTRDVLMKHGLRFDVEEAGYLYMTLNVFSAIHGLTTNNLVQELHTASKELPVQPTAQQLRPITAVPTA